MKSLALTVSLFFFVGCAPEVNEFSDPTESAELDRARGDSDEDSVTCEDACAARARRHFRVCVSEGGTKERCATRARAFLDHCEDRCEADRAWARCEDACGDRAKAFYRRCVDAGGSEARCGHAAREHYGDCLDRCDELDCE